MAKTASKSAATSAIDFLAQPGKHPAAAVCAVFGDEAFLKREVLAAIRSEVLGQDQGEFSLTTFVGRDATLRDVRDALATASLFGSGRRLVIVEDADPFITDHRPELEDYVAKPQPGAVLVLEVKTWPATTRLAKAVAETGLSVECKSLKEPETKRWLLDRATTRHGVRLESAAAEALLELVPLELGILAQELEKLSLLAGDKGRIDAQLVTENVGGWRTRTTWEMIDAAADGRTRDAFEQLHRLIAAGEKPHAIFPPLSHSLRQLAAAARLVDDAQRAGRRLPLHAALKQAGVFPFKLANAERQLRQIGRERALCLVDWLLAADLAMKGYNSADARARMELERLLLRLAPLPSPRQLRPSLAV